MSPLSPIPFVRQLASGCLRNNRCCLEWSYMTAIHWAMGGNWWHFWPREMSQLYMTTHGWLTTGPGIVGLISRLLFPSSWTSKKAGSTVRKWLCIRLIHGISCLIWLMILFWCTKGNLSREEKSKTCSNSECRGLFMSHHVLDQMWWQISEIANRHG